MGIRDGFISVIQLKNKFGLVLGYVEIYLVEGVSYF